MEVPMQRKSFDDMSCALALCLEQVGEWWSLLIVRDALHGLTRFDEFQRSLGISTNSLARRLKTLTESGLLERRRYQDRPPRDEYVLTERGRDLQPAIEALRAWGAKHGPSRTAPVRLVDRKTGRVADPELVDRSSGLPISPEAFVYVAGPQAPEVKLARMPHANSDPGQ
jgi:DNA-binding HxlR family transcriptional regulator